MATLTGVAGTLPLPNIATTAAPGTGVTTADQNVTAQQLLNQDATLGAHLDGTAFTDKVKINGRKVLRRASVALTDASQTVSVAQGDKFILSNAPGAIRSISLDSTTVVPVEGECVEFLVRGALATGKQYSFFRGDATPIADLYGNAAADAGVWAEFEFSGGVWRLGVNMGGGATGGVVPGAGA